MTQSSENVDGQWGNVETQYQRRFDLIPNLVSTEGYADVEKETLIAVTEALQQHLSYRGWRNW